MVLGARGRVLLVDRSGRLEARLADALDGSDLAVETVGTATECLRALEGDGVAGVVSEYDLPDLDGRRLLRSVQVGRPTVPFVLLAPGDVAEAAVVGPMARIVAEDAAPATVVDGLRQAMRQSGHVAETEGQARYRHLVETSPAPINLFDAGGESIWCNDAALDLLGLDSRGELIGHSIFEFVHPDDRSVARRELERVIEAGESVGPTEMRLRPSDGTVKDILVSTAVGRFRGAAIGQAVIVDVTEVGAARTALREERDLLETTLDALNDVFYVFDDEGRLVRWNDHVERVTGYDADALAGRSFQQFFDDGDAARAALAARRVVERGEDDDTLEATLRTATGERIPYEFRSRRFEDADGEVKMVGIGRDVSDRTERERQLQVLETWLRHNIRNQVNLIQGQAELIERSEDASAVDRARRIQAITDRLIGQAEKVRTVTAMLTAPGSRVRVDLRAVAEEHADVVRAAHPEADVTVEGEPDCRALAVPRIETAVEELIENAVEHADHEAPSVSVTVRETDGGVALEVADDGPGIPETEREVLLSSRRLTPLRHTSGLGLVFVYWVARRSDGSIRFRENEPTGSVVTLELPIGDVERG